MEISTKCCFVDIVLLFFKNSLFHVVDISEKESSAFGEGWCGGVGEGVDGEIGS